MSNEDHPFHQLLIEFAEGHGSLQQLQDQMRNDINFDFARSPAYRKINHNQLEGFIKIDFKAQWLCVMLKRYIDEEVSKIELSNWAAFIVLSELFVPEGDTEEEKWLAGDGPVWDILQRLMTPEVFDGLDKYIVNQYLRWLSANTVNGRNE